MQSHELLGQLSSLQQMITDLFSAQSDQDSYRSWTPELPPLAWLLGKSVYTETFWVREIVQEDDDMTARVRTLFSDDKALDPATWQHLPPKDHLLNWALELQDENLTRLANPAKLPEHPLLENNQLLWLILQQEAVLYEQMLAQLTARSIREPRFYNVSQVLEATPPSTDLIDVPEGHYRVGSKNDEAGALDNELPAQIVQLSGFRIDKQPITNSAYLGFMQDAGYTREALWSEAGRAWVQTHPHHPVHWQQDTQGNWYGVGINASFDLIGSDPVSGLSQHEALAYANWVGSQDGPLKGAVIQHEYQWEAATRTRSIQQNGQVWEWCSNEFHPYTGYQPAPWPAASSERFFNSGHITLKGASLHTQRALRRLGYRLHAQPDNQMLFAGSRLVFPPSDMPWH